MGESIIRREFRCRRITSSADPALRSSTDCSRRMLLPSADEKKLYTSMLLNNLDEIEKIADNVLKKHNTGYTSKAYLKKIYIPRKIYKNIILPEGSYDSLVVELGSGMGENWWCVVYPPLCFTESVYGNISEEGKKQLEKNLSPDAYSLITSEEMSVEYTFKFVELVQKIKKYIQ